MNMQSFPVYVHMTNQICLLYSFDLRSPQRIG